MHSFKFNKAKVLLQKKAPHLAKKTTSIPLKLAHPYLYNKQCGLYILHKKSTIKHFKVHTWFLKNNTIDVIAYGIGFLVLSTLDKKTIHLNKTIKGNNNRNTLLYSYNVVIRKHLDKLFPRPVAERGFEDYVSKKFNVDCNTLRTYDETPPAYVYLSKGQI